MSYIHLHVYLFGPLKTHRQDDWLLPLLFSWGRAAVQAHLELLTKDDDVATQWLLPNGDYLLTVPPKVRMALGEQP